MRRTVMMVLIALVGAALVGYVIYDTATINQKTQALLRAPGVRAATSDESAHQDEGVEATPVAPDAFATYQVDAAAPRLITIESLGIRARVRPMGLNRDNTIQAPKNIYDAGWYTGSAAPGEAGAMFIDGHASGATHLGLFGNLASLHIGDRVTIEKGDHTSLSYRVVHVETVALEAVDMHRVTEPFAGVEKGLNLMTCTGRWMNEGATLDHRVVVYTEQVTEQVPSR